MDACAAAPCPGSQDTLIASGTVADLIGTWRFTVDALGGGTDDITYRFDRLEDDGRRAVGEQVGSGDDVHATASGSDFEMFDRESVNCRKYVFHVVGLDRLEGSSP